MVHTRGPESKLARRFRANILSERGGGRITAEEMSRCVAAARAAFGVRAGPPSPSVSKPLHEQRRTGAARRKRARGKRQRTRAASSAVGAGAAWSAAELAPTSPALGAELPEQVPTVLEEEVTTTDEEGGGVTWPPSMPLSPGGA